jgi:sRNA-binding protein
MGVDVGVIDNVQVKERKGKERMRQGRIRRKKKREKTKEEEAAATEEEKRRQKKTYEDGHGTCRHIIRWDGAMKTTF